MGRDAERHRDGADVHHGPADADYPKGFGEASWWPLLCGLGVGGDYLGVGAWLVAGPDLGVPVVAGSSLLVAFAAGGWLFHGYFAGEPPATARDGPGRAYRRTTRWVALAEVMAVGALLAAAGYIRATGPPGAVAEPASLPTAVTLANTGLLVAAGVTLLWARGALRRGDVDGTYRGFGFTVGLGGLFLVGQAVEVHELVAAGFGPPASPFAGAFYAATAYHALHVAVGMGLVAFLALRARKGWYGEVSANAAEDRAVGVAGVDAAVTFWGLLVALWVLAVVVLHG